MLYTCEKCNKRNSSYDIFGVGWPEERYYCRSYRCIPKIIQIKMWLKEPSKGDIKYILKNWFK